MSLAILLFTVLLILRVIIIMNDEESDWQETKQEVKKAHRGNIYTFDQDEFVAAMETAESKADVVNEEGLKLQKEFTYEKTLNKILEVIQNDTP